MKKLKTSLFIIASSLMLSGCTFIPSDAFSAKTYTVYWMQKYHDPAYVDPQIKILETDKNVKKGEMPSYDGPTPVQSDTESSTFEFKGWTPELAPVTEDVEYYTVFESKPKTFTVTWCDDELNELKVETYNYGEIPSYSEDNIVTKENNAEYTYTFKGWAKSLNGEILEEFEKVTRNVTYFAIFERLTNNYTVKWVNYDNTVLDEETYYYGAMPSYKKATPVREGNDIVDKYPFIGWDKEIDRVTGDITYKAVFDLLESPTSYFYIDERDTYCIVSGPRYAEFETTLHRISIPSTYHDKPITSIGMQAFQGCTGLTTVVLSDSITEIQYGAFYNCSNVTSMTLSNNLDSILSKAFYGMSKLEELVIPDSVTSIQNNILEKSGVKRLTVPYIGSSKTEPQKFSYFGIYTTQITKLVITEGCTELTANVTDGGKTDIYLPHSIQKVPYITAKNLYYNGTLYEWEKLDRTFENSITSLYLNDGNDYTLLTQVNIQSGLTEISDYAFSGIGSITSINIGGTVTKIGNSAFVNCSSLTTAIVGDSVTELGNSVFANSGLVSLEIGTGLNKTGLSTFDTSSFRNVYYDGTVEDYCHIQFVTVMFSYASSPRFYIRDNSGDVSFNNHNYSLLTELVIPDSITAIGNGQFYKFEQLTSIEFGSGVTSIGRMAFQGCTGLTTLNVPSNVETCDWLAFSDCTSLTTATVEGIKEFNSTFAGCNKLEVVNANVLETYNNYSFEENSVRRINISSSETLKSDFGIIYDKQMKELKFCPRGYVGAVIVPEGVETIAPGAFSNCRSVTEIILPSTLKTIGNRAFNSCTALKDLVVPNGVTSIGEEAFGNNHYHNITLPFIGSSPTENKDFAYFFAKNGAAYNITITSACTSLSADAFKSNLVEEVTIPNTVTSLPQSIFKPCTAIKKLTLPFVGGSDTNNNYLSYLFGADTYNKYGVVPSTLKEVVITDATTIGEYAFFHQSSLTDVTIPDTVNSIGERALYECSGIVNLRIPFIGDSPDSSTNTIFAYIFGAKTETSMNSYLPETLDTVTFGNRLTKIPARSFYNISNIRHVILSSSITRIGEKAFYYCHGLRDIDIPNTVTTVDPQAFDNCNNLATAVIGNGVTVLPDSMFYSCTALKTVTIGTNVTTMNTSAFSYCSALETIYFNATNAAYTTTNADSPFRKMTSIKKVVFGDNVRFIAKGLFRACNQINTVVFGSDLMSIGEYAFYACSSLNTINYNGTSLEWGGIIQGDYWHDSVPAEKVICLKGNVKEVEL